MKSLGVLVNNVRIYFTCGGILDLTSEDGQLGFPKMAALKLLFIKSQHLEF